MLVKKQKWGFLRETAVKAKAAGIDRDTGLHRTGLDEYLHVIFPEVSDWIHDKALGQKNGITYRTRPDYRSETLKLIVEFDGLQHYTKPDVIERDDVTTKTYGELGYKVVRIPYFIQLSNRAIETLFGVSISAPMFDENIPSLGIKGQNTPAYLCPAGVKRMARDFMKLPEQFLTNLNFLKEQNAPYLTGIEFLEREYKLLAN